MQRYRTILPFLWGGLLLFSVSSAGEISIHESTQNLNPAAIERGKELSLVCAACHQPDGRGMDLPAVESWPRLAGQNRDYLVAQMKAYKDGTRENATMPIYVNNLNDEEMMDLATYFASLPMTEADKLDEIDEAQYKRGEFLVQVGDWDNYIVGCSKCHGQDSMGVGATFPALAGQHSGYIIQQLEAWQENKRQNDPQGLMASIAKRMNAEDIEAVALYLSQQSVNKAHQTQPDENSPTSHQ